MTMMTHEKPEYIHPLVDEAKTQLKQGKMDRREFIRVIALLGIAAPTAYSMAGLSPELGRSAQAQTPKSGGTLRVSMVVQDISEPAQYDWSEKSNIARHICEYLTITGPDNVTRPYLAESWRASEDLTVWTFNLRKDVTWHNGDIFNADDVVFNMTRWLDPATGSSNIGLFAALVEEYDSGEKDENGQAKMAKRMRPNAVEKVDSHTVRFHCKRPVLAMPENFYNYPTMIVHRDFTGDLSKAPVGTGPYTLDQFKVGEIATLKRVDKPYWGGEIYLDEIHYIDHGNASAAQLAALASGQVDMIYEFDITALKMAQSIPNTKIYEASTAQTAVARFNTEVAPFDNKKVRQAIQACIDVAPYKNIVYQGYGQEGEHHHVAQIHPEYFALPKMKKDVAKAKALLAEAGYPDGLDITIDVGNTSGTWQQTMCEVMKEQLAEAGISLQLNVMPAAKYWEIWDKTDFGLTQWTHRPLGIMVLSLAYRSGVPWNETKYANPDFDKALEKAEALINVDARREAMAEVQSILQQDAVMVQPLWRPVFFLASEKIQGLQAHPTQYHQFADVWIA